MGGADFFMPSMNGRGNIYIKMGTKKKNSTIICTLKTNNELKRFCNVSNKGVRQHWIYCFVTNDESGEEKFGKLLRYDAKVNIKKYSDLKRVQYFSPVFKKWLWYSREDLYHFLSYNKGQDVKKLTYNQAQLYKHYTYNHIK
jgi:hypothetical protein